MKKLIWIFFVLTLVSNAQVKNPIQWKSEIKHEKDNIYEAVFTAILESGWHVYSKDIKVENAIPTSFSYPENSSIKLIGPTKEIGKKIEEYSDVFEGTLIYYSNKVEYRQRIEVVSSKPVVFEADVEYQICNDKVCLAPDEETFSFKLIPKSINQDKSTVLLNDTVKQLTQSNPKIDSVPLTPIKDSIQKINTVTESYKNQIIIPSFNIADPINKDCGDKIIKKEGYLWIFAFGFLGGLVALLTPCVYPMIPLTISYFTKHAKSKKEGKKDALIYAFFIVLIFVLFTLPFHLISGINPDIFNQIATNVWLNIIFFVIFILFAFSFFGYYDITLPGWMANKSDKASESGGIIGLFFMALTLVIVSFSCTGPVLGSILANAIQNPNQLTIAFGGCGLAWALVFGIFALFPQFLQTMPKSGGWMNTVKVVLGFLELALAFKFLSKADLVAKTFLLKREIFIAIWILICISIVLYLLGVVKFPHDNKKVKINIGRIIWACLFGLIGVYMIPGLFPSEKPNLKLLSGLTPPMQISIYPNNQKNGVLGLNIFHDYEKAREIAKKENKPILIDFTGYGCENCRKMEEYVWSEPDIWNILHDKFIISSLYVDDSEELPNNEQQTLHLKDGRKRKIKTIGNKWSTFQRENFNSNSQPFYVLVTPDNRILNFPVAGYMDKEEFKNFLLCGYTTYDELN